MKLSFGDFVLLHKKLYHRAKGKLVKLTNTNFQRKFSNIYQLQ